jgi:hypothetical protein
VERLELDCPKGRAQRLIVSTGVRVEPGKRPDRTINVHHDMIPGPSGAADGDQPYEEPGSSDEYGYDGP